MLDPSTFQVGDHVRFDHFGVKRRPGRVVKITPTRLYIEWTAPSSGKTRVVPLRFTAVVVKAEPLPPSGERTFETTPERDVFIETHFPARRVTERPGLYRLPDGGHLSVWCDTVRWSPTAEQPGAVPDQETGGPVDPERREDR